MTEKEKEARFTAFIIFLCLASGGFLVPLKIAGVVTWPWVVITMPFWGFAVITAAGLVAQWFEKSATE